MPEDTRFPGSGVTDNCRLQCGCWELNPGPLEEQLVLITTMLSFQSSKSISNIIYNSNMYKERETRRFWFYTQLINLYINFQEILWLLFYLVVTNKNNFQHKIQVIWLMDYLCLVERICE